MNLFYPILIETIAFFLLTITNSYTQSSQEAISDVHIFVQIFVRDSDGNLWPILNQINLLTNFEALNTFLDLKASQGNDSIYEDMKKWQQILGLD